MDQSRSIEAFEKLVYTKFNIYNSLFLNLPYRKVSNIGMLIPLLQDTCKQGLESGIGPQKILEDFFSSLAKIESEDDKIEFMFRVIQYVERQVVLFDSVEDAAFNRITELGNSLSIKDFFQLVDNEKNWDRISEKTSSFSVRIVFTAHPTQFYSHSVLDIMSKLKRLINNNRINPIDLILQQLGLTSLINSKKPTPLDEAKNIIYFLRNVYYDAVGNIYNSMKKTLQNNGFDNPNILKLGFWPGGDRDGNPFVTAEVTRNVADELRITLMKCYYQDVKKMQQKLTFREVEDILQDLMKELYNTMFFQKGYLNYEEIINPLNSIRELLIKKYHKLYLKDLDSLIDKVKIFRTHFASLDIRQHHGIHKKLVEEVLKKEKIIDVSLDEIEKDDLIQILLHRDFEIHSHKYEDEVLVDTIQNISQLKTIQEKNGEEGCNRYIISNSEDIYSVLFVYALFRWCGWQNEKITFDIIPLFETMEGMKCSESIMHELFNLPEYRSHVERRLNKQTIMLGFSDGTKDGGYLKANWSIFKTKEILSTVCEEHNICAIFFDGRGGPPARGGGKTHKFYAAQSEHISNKEIQLTIQGQTITSKYGTQEQFIHNFEQLLLAGLSNDYFKNANKISVESRGLLENLATISFEKYEELKNHPQFIPYLENRSTLKYYNKANIGSRPGKRGNKDNFEFKDLRAIPFVGSWSQLKQNIPGYYGIGTALKVLVNEGKLEELKRLFREVSFFKTLMLNSMMSLSKSNFDLTSYMKEDIEFKEFWNILYDEYELSKEMLLLISDFNMLMEEEPISRKSIEIRDKIVLPLLVIQQYALQKVNQNTGRKELYEKIVTRSLYGNINASRNSA